MEYVFYPCRMFSTKMKSQPIFRDGSDELWLGFKIILECLRFFEIVKSVENHEGWPNNTFARADISRVVSDHTSARTLMAWTTSGGIIVKTTRAVSWRGASSFASTFSPCSVFDSFKTLPTPNSLTLMTTQ